MPTGSSAGRARWALVAATWLTLMCASAAAVRPTAFEASSSPTRTLQQEALSNSNGCLESIPKCESGACATRSVMGLARWVCLRCLANYEPVVDGSGQDNILQCVCPKGTFENGTDATSCTRCEKNQYCPGGDKVENPASRGTPVECGPGLVTRNTGARSAVDCVAPAGYAMTSPTAGTACGRSEYAPAFNRLTRCMRCQSGLEESETSGLTPQQRNSKRAVCKVPPGKYMSQGLVRTCPQGFYRENYEAYDAAVAQQCLACNPGITTNGAGAKAPAECNRVLAGYGIQQIPALNSSSQEIPVLQQNSSGLPAATMCPLGSYSTGGYCAECPSGTVTRVLGAKSIEECVVPPGYSLSGGSMAPCDNGFFRDGWVLYSDPKAASCTPCGEGISSDAREADENPLAVNGSLVRVTSDSCYIEPGMGMVAQARNSFKGVQCPVNTYGVASRVYGWTAAPCKPCPRNMITDGVAGSTTMDACINPGGYGYASEGASRCSIGFYAAKGSRKPCQRCPEGRTTQDNPERQQYVSHCDVTPGFGVVGGGSLPANGDIFQADLTGMNEMQILSLSVLKCPTGYYGGGESIGAQCSKCPEGSTTKQPGSTVLEDCSVCLPGRGRANSTSPCVLCDYGSWQPGGLAECQPCPDTTFYAPVDGVGPTYTSVSSTFSKGATGEEWCVPMRSQLSPEAGQAYFSMELSQSSSVNTMFATSGIESLDECLAQCDMLSDQCCFAQYEADTKTCTTATLPPADELDTGYQVFYKLPPSTLSAASSIKDDANSTTSAASVRPARSWLSTIVRGRSGAAATASGSTSAAQPAVRAKMLASGLYAKCHIDHEQAPAWQQVGSSLSLDARTFAKGAGEWRAVADLNECQEMCDNSNVCWGGIYQGTDTGGRCIFRGGVDALRTRSFFALPSPGTVPNMILPGGSTFYFAFTSSDIAALEDQGKASARLTHMEKAVMAVLGQLLPTTGATISSFQEITPGAQVVVGLTIDGMHAYDLASLLAGNSTTTALLARELLTECLKAGADAVLFSGLYIASWTDDSEQALETPLLIDGCSLISDYCGSHGTGTCSLNVCTCQAGWSGPQCTQGTSP